MGCSLFLSFLLVAEGAAFNKKESSALSHYIMAMMYERMGDADSAIREHQKALRVDYANSAVHLGLAASYVKKNDLSGAIKELNLAIKFDPQAVEPHALLALIYSIQNKLELATGEYEVALENASLAQPKNIEIYKSLGALYLQQKKLQEAQKVYRLVLTVAPRDAEAHFYLGNIYDSLNQREEAVGEFKKALEARPDYAEALNYLGYLYLEENKNLAQAESMINKALEIEPDNGAYLDSLGWLYFKQGKSRQAIKALEKASFLMADPVIYEHLGDAYLKVGDLESAKLNWRKSLELNPKQDNINRKLEGLPKQNALPR